MWSSRRSPRRQNDSARDHRDNRSIRQDDDAHFWDEAASWEAKSHDVDPDAPTRPTGIERITTSRQADLIRERWSLFNLDPFVSRIVLIVVGFALVVPVAWTTRRTADESLPDVGDAASVVVATSNDIAEGLMAADGSASTGLPPTSVLAFASETPTSNTSAPGLVEQSNSSVAETTTLPEGEARSVARETATTTAMTAPVCGSYYVVRPGDSWTLIADRASMSTRTLLETNSATARDMLYPEDELCLPPGVRVVIPTTTVSARPATSVAVATTTTEVIPPAPSTADAEAIIRAIWPDDLEDRAVEIAIRESRLQANVHNWCCYGLFQIHWGAHKSWLPSIGVTTKSQLYDAETNARAALKLYERAGGWGPWAL
ncbi:MAG: LysM peptidoglycan-binding domain-containing protein [Ilumatobacteraceae bacterium]